MSLTSTQDLPNAPQNSQSWSVRSMLSIQSAMATMAKTFNALEAILLFEVVVAGVGELVGRRLSVGWYVLLVLTLLINFILRVVDKERVKKE